MWASTAISIPSFYYRTPAAEIRKDDIAVIEDGTRAPGMPTICSTLHCVGSGPREFRANSTGGTLIYRHNLRSFVEGEQPYLGGSVFFNTKLISDCRYEAGGAGPIVRVSMRGLTQSQIALYTPEFASRLKEAGFEISGVPAPERKVELGELAAPVQRSLPQYAKDSIFIVRATGADRGVTSLARCTGSFPHVATFEWLDSNEPSARTGTFSITPVSVNYEIVGSPDRVTPQPEKRFHVHTYRPDLNRVVVGEAICRELWGEGRFLMQWVSSQANQELGLRGTFAISEPPTSAWAEREAKE